MTEKFEQNFDPLLGRGRETWRERARKQRERERGRENYERDRIKT